MLTDNGTIFTERFGNTWTPEKIRAMRAEKVLFRCHSFEAACADLNHQLMKLRHPRTNGQVERMNRTIKDVTVKRLHYGSHDLLRQHLADLVAAYNFARRLETLRGLTPYETNCKVWMDKPAQFTRNPHHQMPGPNIWRKKLFRDLERATYRDGCGSALRGLVAAGSGARGGERRRWFYR